MLGPRRCCRPDDRDTAVRQREHAEGTVSEEPLSRSIFVRMFGLEMGNECGLFVGPLADLDARCLPHARASTVGGDQQVCRQSAPIGQRKMIALANTLDLVDRRGKSEVHVRPVEHSEQCVPEQVVFNDVSEFGYPEFFSVEVQRGRSGGIISLVPDAHAIVRARARRRDVLPCTCMVEYCGRAGRDCRNTQFDIVAG